MAQDNNAYIAAEPDRQAVADSRKLWDIFSKGVLAAIIASAVILSLMALFLL
ncbi:MAG: aa3-type cytochrome c oxidase subunit IV [Micavibrio sp.]